MMIVMVIDVDVNVGVVKASLPVQCRNTDFRAGLQGGLQYFNASSSFIALGNRTISGKQTREKGGLNLNTFA